MTSALLIERNRDSATMTSACLLEEAMSSDDEVSCDVSNQQNTFQTGRICVQRIEFEQRLIYEDNSIEEERLLVEDDCAIIQCTNRWKKNRSTKQSTTIREELATSVDC
ncbi:la-related protein 1A [Dorcoceras hygrometricum]|uniref:La-related protein 1A n=1 Tax=Dorcoceras hygrometricum TaxID=472368 RepID=A0A2Z7BVS5_9LAMI|nr:la-related protein 1A [Dorcoceras hygrometricum]